jgi:hypothetical protein
MVIVPTRGIRKLEALKVRGVQKEKKLHFVRWKTYFSSCYFFSTPFSFAIQR